jgi:hypothetical protein
MPAKSARRTIAILAAGAISTFAFAGTAMAHSGSSWHPHPGAAYSNWAEDNGLSGNSGKWNKDNDRDGLKNWGEFRSGTNPKDSDSDNDRVKDSFEDRDRDGLTNLVEYKLRTNPKKHDSLNSIESGEIEVKGSVESYKAPTEASDGELKIKVAGVVSTLALPKGATVIGGDALKPGNFVEVEIEREDGITIVKAHVEDAPGVGGTGTTSTGTNDDTTTGGTTTDDTTNGTSTSGKNKGGGGGDD